MLKLWKNKRIPHRATPFVKALFHTGLITAAGLLFGIAAKLLDIYTSNLGNIFSQMSVWIFLCTLLAVYSSTPKRAAVNVFLFCAGMLAAYYLTAELTASVYSTLFIYGWIMFALFSPALGFCTWYAKGKGLLAKIITVSIIIVLFGWSNLQLIGTIVADMAGTLSISFCISIVLLGFLKQWNTAMFSIEPTPFFLVGTAALLLFTLAVSTVIPVIKIMKIHPAEVIS